LLHAFDENHQLLHADEAQVAPSEDPRNAESMKITQVKTCLRAQGILQTRREREAGQFPFAS
jgi:hypothetical protein